MKIRFLGSGDAFCHGGRMNACILVDREESGGKFLIDCGATAMVALHKFNINTDEIDMIFISHLHGDHYAGLPFFLMNSRFYKRKKPLAIYGPIGVEQRVKDTMELFFPDSTKIEFHFPLCFNELAVVTGITDDLKLTSYEMSHFSGAPSLAFRIEADNKILSYSGDTEWVHALADVALKADLFICECYSYDKAIKNHLSFRTIEEHSGKFQARKTVLTHLGPEMLAECDKIPAAYLVAEDGLEIVL